ncbi:hypothetical protein CARUB_v10001442mg [Capsella rubella]|uniref:Uncharacterized protein n=1 Tax=Capsella rubella TaxID=81985 RepID=R0FGL3_9BRAS|nr:hypothetical protein CARUB_v10001442mg [Capsella rubella]
MVRMHRRATPNVGRVLMIEIKSVDEEGAVVSLLTYDNLEGRINEIGSVIGRIEPAQVQSLDPLVLSKSTLNFDQRMRCEASFNKRRHVRKIMLSVARATDTRDLLGLYKLCKWPSYDALNDQQSKFWRNVLPSIPMAVQNALRYSIANITVRSWRILKPGILSSSVLEQIRSTCWAFGLGRQFESLLKNNNKLPMEESLSIDYIIEHTEWDHPDGSLDDLFNAEPLFTCEGVKSSIVGEPPFFLEEFKVLRDDDYNTEAAWDRLLVDSAMNAHGCSIAATVVIYPSYENNKKGNLIFKPTLEEYNAFKANPKKKNRLHTMNLTGNI